MTDYIQNHNQSHVRSSKRTLLFQKVMKKIQIIEHRLLLRMEQEHHQRSRERFAASSTLSTTRRLSQVIPQPPPPSPLSSAHDFELAQQRHDELNFSRSNTMIN